MSTPENEHVGKDQSESVNCYPIGSKQKVKTFQFK